MSAATYLPRSAWNARPANPGPGPMDPALVQGIAFHWPGSTTRRPISKAAVPRALRGWQDFHIDGRGWSDIAYQVAIDQWGRVWTLRGLETRSGANGGTWPNVHYCAVLLLLVQDEQPSELMLEAARDVVLDARQLYPRATRLVGHQQVRPEPTSCPGPAVMAALKRGDLEPIETGDDMGWRDRLALWSPLHDRRGDDMSAGQQLNQARGYASAAYELAKRSDKRLDSIEADLRELVTKLRGVTD